MAIQIHKHLYFTDHSLAITLQYFLILHIDD